MSDVQREPCPGCGEPAPPSLRVCPFCRGSLQVDVVLDAPIAEPRTRYLLAREISSLGSPASPFSTLQQTLASPRPVLARGASRLAALSLRERLADFGLQAILEPAGTGQSSGRASRGFAAVGLGAVAVFSVLLWMGPRGGSADLPPAPRPAARGSVPAKARSWPVPLPPLSPRELSELAAPWIVRLRCEDRLVSGFFVAPDLVLTRGAAIGDGTGIKVLVDGEGETGGEVEKRDDGIGLALVRVPGSRAEPLQLGDAAVLRGGERVFFPIMTEGSPASLQEGALGTTARQFQGIAHLALAASLPAGSDGGPVLDVHGHVLGLVAIQGDGAYLLPINYAYTESHLIAPPRPAPNLQKWRELLAEVAIADQVRIGARR